LESVKFSMVLNAVALLMLIVGFKKYPLKWESFHGGVLTLFMVVVSSAIFAFKPALAWPRVYDYFLTMLQYVFICAFVRDEKQLRSLYWAIALTVTIICTRYCYGNFALAEYGWEGPDGDRNNLAMLIVMVLPFLFVLGFTATKWSARMLALVSIVPCALVVVFTLSRGGFLGLSAVGLYVLFRLHHKRWLIPLAIVGVIFGLSFVPPEFYARIMTVKTAAKTDASSRGRINAWHAAIAMAQDRPLTGVGVGNFLVHFRRYAPDPDDVHVAHSSFFQILGDTGIPGAITWVGLVVALFWFSARTERKIRIRERGAWTDDRYYIMAVKASLLGYVVCGAFLSQEDYDYFYQLLAIASRLAVFTAAKGKIAAKPSVSLPSGAGIAVRPAVARAG
jgi:probable O-glycosylation ligase (exosortase A-associated)